MTWSAWYPGLLTLAVLALYGVLLGWWVRRELARHTKLMLDALQLGQVEQDLHHRLSTTAILDRLDHPTRAEERSVS